MPKVKSPPPPGRKRAGDADEAERAVTLRRDDSMVRAEYRFWWHELDKAGRSTACLGFTQLNQRLQFTKFTKDSFHDWVHTDKRLSTDLSNDICELANYLWRDFQQAIRTDATIGDPQAGEQFIEGWYDSVDLGAPLLGWVLKTLPGIYAVYRVSTFSPNRITRGAMLIWEFQGRRKRMLRTVEINQFALDSQATSTKPELSEIYYGAAIRKKSWLLIESFLQGEGDPSSYKFALPHDRLTQKYVCLQGYYFGFPVAPQPVPTMRAAVLERLSFPQLASPLPQFVSNESAYEYLYQTIRSGEVGAIDLVSAVPSRILELLRDPHAAHWVVMPSQSVRAIEDAQKQK